MILTWNVFCFEELTTTLLYEILALRQEIFVVEQSCAYLDADNYDQTALHLCGFDGEIIVAYSRIIPPLKKYPEPSIGRVLTAKSIRNMGLGRELMNRAIAECKYAYMACSIRISAQLYLEKFYANLGFKTIGEPYLEDEIPHIEMLWHE